MSQGDNNVRGSEFYSQKNLWNTSHDRGSWVWTEQHVKQAAASLKLLVSPLSTLGHQKRIFCQFSDSNPHLAAGSETLRGIISCGEPPACSLIQFTVFPWHVSWRVSLCGFSCCQRVEQRRASELSKAWSLHCRSEGNIQTSGLILMKKMSANINYLHYLNNCSLNKSKNLWTEHRTVWDQSVFLVLLFEMLHNQWLLLYQVKSLTINDYKIVSFLHQN